jgi:hypothetical protein
MQLRAKQNWWEKIERSEDAFNSLNLQGKCLRDNAAFKREDLIRQKCRHVYVMTTTICISITGYCVAYMAGAGRATAKCGALGDRITAPPAVVNK